MSVKNPQFDQYAETAIGFMHSHEITPRPRNYRVWFEYAAGSTPALNQVVDKMIEDNEQLDEETTLQFHEQFFNHGAKFNAAIEDAGEVLTEKLSSAIELIRTAGRGTKAYGDALDTISTSLDAKDGSEISPGSLKSIVDTLVVATTEMSTHTKSLEKKLEENTKEVEELREHLEQTKKEAITDQLTKLGNRKHFDYQIERVMNDSLAGNEPFCLIMTDIDKFKAFNDTWGHQTGDQVLRLVASCLDQEVRTTDIAARYGGEEFALILPKTALEDATVVAEKVRTTVQNKKVVKRSTGEDLGTITISLGVAEFKKGDDINSLIARADACLYQAKEAGRNCVIREDQESLEKKAG